MAPEIESKMPVSSVLPRDSRRIVSSKNCSRALAEVLADARHLGESPVATVQSFLKSYSIELPEGLTAEELTGEIFALIYADKLLDDEYRQAVRATSQVLNGIFGTQLRLTGWLPGSTVAHRGSHFTLTGFACPSCGVNPECHGVGGGTRCMAVESCGWWFCF